MTRRFSMILSFLLCCFLYTALAPIPMKAAASPITPFWVAATNITQRMTVDPGRDAHVTVSLWANSSSCDKIKIIVKLQQRGSRGWGTLATFNASGQSPCCDLIKTHPVIRGCEYRIVSAFKLYKNDVLVEAIDDVNPFYYGRVK